MSLTEAVRLPESKTWFCSDSQRHTVQQVDLVSQACPFFHHEPLVMVKGCPRDLNLRPILKNCTPKLK